MGLPRKALEASNLLRPYTIIVKTPMWRGINSGDVQSPRLAGSIPDWYPWVYGVCPIISETNYNSKVAPRPSRTPVGMSM